MQQAEREGHQPWKISREAWLAVFEPYNLAGQEQNAEGDAGFDRRPRHMNDPQGGKRECDRVRESERCHCEEKNSQILYKHHQSEHEEQMVEAEENVLDAMGDIGHENSHGSLSCRDVDP